MLADFFFLLLLFLALLGVEGVDYPGGWLPGTQQCVDICTHSSAEPVCPTRDPACLRKKQQPGDYDFLLLEQLFLPQFCRDLLAGVDPTISHRNVNKYPRGITCEPSLAVSKLSIHGLWPNYNAGFSACCNVSNAIRNQPLDALGFAAKMPDLLAELGQVWVDPTQQSSFNTLCELYNHEFQKHGLCYTADGGINFDQSARDYFLWIHTIAEVTSLPGTIVGVAEFGSRYRRKGMAGSMGFSTNRSSTSGLVCSAANVSSPTAADLGLCQFAKDRSSQRDFASCLVQKVQGECRGVASACYFFDWMLALWVLDELDELVSNSKR
ncbi:hypothetical protein BBJ28_00021174 [Nothophytophthora sp. Chile5]|nr:hypothetical protein BBJ28_00021174 [Nothophytophthora sp. Chile5]